MDMGQVYIVNICKKNPTRYKEKHESFVMHTVSGENYNNKLQPQYRRLE